MNFRILFLSLFLFLILLFSYPSTKAAIQPDSAKAVEKDKTEWVDKWWGKDKVKHFVLSAFLAGVSYKIYHNKLHNRKEHSLYFSSGFTFSLGLGKEIYDETRPQKKFSYKDLVYDLLGIGVGLLIATR
jgi:uncharacterized protein YfiM (DUF2279 family)